MLMFGRIICNAIHYVRKIDFHAATKASENPEAFASAHVLKGESPESARQWEVYSLSQGCPS